MRKRVWAVGLLVFAVGCGGGETDKSTGGGGDAPAKENGGQPDKPAPEAKPDPAAVKQLESERDALLAKVKKLEEEFKALVKKHEEERAALPSVTEKRKLQQQFVQAKRDANKAQNKFLRMEKRLEQLKGAVDTSATGKLKELRDKEAALEKERSKIYEKFQQEMKDAESGKVEASPVLRELLTLRGIKKQWFAATKTARRGTVDANQKKIINNGFRSFLRENPERAKTVGGVLQHEAVPQGKTPENYDYTDLDFYLLMEFREEQLSRLNIAREKKVLSENKGQLEKLDAQLDALAEQISGAMMAGGGDLEEYEDLRGRLGSAKWNASYLAGRVEILGEQLSAIDEVADKHMKAEEEADAAIAKAKKELGAVVRKLRQLQ